MSESSFVGESKCNSSTSRQESSYFTGYDDVLEQGGMVYYSVPGRDGEPWHPHRHGIYNNGGGGGGGGDGGRPHPCRPYFFQNKLGGGGRGGAELATTGLNEISRPVHTPAVPSLTSAAGHGDDVFDDDDGAFPPELAARDGRCGLLLLNEEGQRYARIPTWFKVVFVLICVLTAMSLVLVGVSVYIASQVSDGGGDGADAGGNDGNYSDYNNKVNNRGGVVGGGGWDIVPGDEIDMRMTTKPPKHPPHVVEDVPTAAPSTGGTSGDGAPNKDGQNATTPPPTSEPSSSFSPVATNSTTTTTTTLPITVSPTTSPPEAQVPKGDDGDTGDVAVRKQPMFRNGPRRT